MMHPIALKIQKFLTDAVDGKAKISEELIEEFGEICKKALRKSINQDEKRDKFTLRMSSIGRPLCQLQMEAAGVQGDKPSYNTPIKFAYGDISEGLLLTIMKAAGVKVVSQFEKVSLPVAGIELEGTYDVEIDEKPVDGIYDIKSASPYSFSHKFTDRGGFKVLEAEDHFGYVTQGYGYGEAKGRKFQGWIVMDKASGQICVTETPAYDDKHRIKALDHIARNVQAIRNEEPFKRCFEPIAEKFRKVETGNTYLPFVCAECPFRSKCWPTAQYLPSIPSDANDPKHYWYVDIKQTKEEFKNVQNKS